jgi:hypothetical protein
MKPLCFASLLLTLSLLADEEPAPYSIGEPTDEEQHYLELINRARADPRAEGILIAATTDPAILYAIRYFGVNMNLFKSEMAAIPPQPPLAMNRVLLGTSRSHSKDMFDLGAQTHIGTNGLGWEGRGESANYDGSLLIENIYASSWFTEFGHASFEIDWGPGGSGGMLPGRAHRFAIHYPPIREAGIGIFYGDKMVDGYIIGPQLVTQDFGSGPPNTAFITGVIYHDLNGNKLYDPGEGIGGVKIIADEGNYVGISAGSGGYAVPVPTDEANYELEFNGPGIQSYASATVTGGANVKVDLILSYSPPMVSGSPVPPVGIPAPFEISEVPGAISYEWQWAVETPAIDDPAESLSRVSATGSDTYPMVSQTVRHTGNASYHVFHDEFKDRALTYDSAFQVGSEGAITFQSRHALSTTGQIAKLQVSDDDRESWKTLWSQAGLNSAGDPSFSLKTVDLSDYAGKQVHLRFFYDYVSGSTAYLFPISQAVGWYVDDIKFSDVSTISAGVVSPANEDRTFEFTAEGEARYLLAARPVFPGRTGSFGPSLPLEASVQNSFGKWASVHEESLDLPANGIMASPEDDLNADGVANILAYALGLDPMTPAGSRVPKARREGNSIVIDYTVIPSRTDVYWGSEATSELGVWRHPDDPSAPAGFVDEMTSEFKGTMSRRATLPISPGSSAFLRMKASLIDRVEPQNQSTR